MKNDKKIPDWVKELLSDEDKFWKVTYPALSFDERVKHWSGVRFRQMRGQKESGLDPYAIYTKEWYQNVKRNEPDFDKIMNVVFSQYWKDAWSREEYLKRINA